MPDLVGDEENRPAEARRPIVYDLTHLVTRLTAAASSGIDRVDLAYGVHFAGADRIVAGAHYGLTGPHLISPRRSRAIVAAAAAAWREGAGEAGFAALLDWLAAPPGAPFAPCRPTGRSQKVLARAARRLAQTRFRLAHDRPLAIPAGAVYLNAAQHAFEFPRFFGWLDRRPDLRKAFLIHDLLPLDYPEYFRASNLGVFRRRLATAFRYADAFIVSTQVVRARLREELARQGAPDRPVHVQPFPSPLEGAADTPVGESGGHPYFVMIGTMEPRKNHLLVLHIWREMLAADANAPRLVLIGARGWENEQVADILDRSVALRGHVAELSGLPSARLARLLRGSCGLLAPSHDEGYGLPVVEALALGAPAIASDIPVFREVTQGRARLLSPLAGPAWRAEIERLGGDADYRRLRQAEARRFAAPTWRGYFAGVEAFLQGL